MEPQGTTLFPIIPFELMIEILLKMRVKSLLRFRVVCKEWCNIIDSKKFVNVHLSRSIQNEMDRSLIIEDESQKSSILSIDLKSLEEAVDLNVRSWWPEDHWHAHCGISVCCTCNGLLCLSSSSKNVALWNPSTKKHLILPTLTFDDDLQLFRELESFFSTAFGFGFDYATRDYKVVSIKEHYNCDTRLVDTEVKVYSIRSNLWRRVQGFPKGHNYRGHGVFVKESLHWLITPSLSGLPEVEISSYQYTIVAFDLTTEEIQIVAIPSDTNGWIADKCFVRIGVIEGCLSASFFDRDVTFDLWILKEYGVEDSWTKLISIHDSNLIARYHLLPVFYSKNFGILVIAETHNCCTEVFWHNFESQFTKRVPIRGLPEYFCGDELLMESLVPLDGSGH